MKKKILLVVLLIIILLGAGAAYAYFATDAFKSGKELFFSYILENNIFEKLEEKKLSEYEEKLENTPYTNKGKITLNMTGVPEESIETLNNSEITFEGKTDAKNELSEQEITLDFAMGINIPILFKQQGETLGIQTDLLNSKYIGIRNENLKELATKFGLDETTIPDKIEAQELGITEEQMKILKDRYIKILQDNLTDDMFTKGKEGNQKTIIVTIPEDKLVNIFKLLLQTLRNDDIIIPILEKFDYGTTFQESIDELISSFETVEINPANKMEIKLFVESKNLKKCETKYFENEVVIMNIVMENTESQSTIKMYVEDELLEELVLSKKTEGNDVTYSVLLKIYDETIVELEADIQYKNLLVLDNVEEIVSLRLLAEDPNSFSADSKTEMNIEYSNQKTFDANVQIDGFNEENAIILNDATDEELQNLLISIYQQLGLM